MAHIPNTAESAQLRVDSDGLGMTGTDRLIGLVDETVLSRGIKEEEMIHEILKAPGGCAATTNVIVQRLRGHTAAIIPPCRCTEETDELLRSLIKGKCFQIGPLIKYPGFQRSKFQGPSRV